MEPLRLPSVLGEELVTVVAVRKHVYAAREASNDVVGVCTLSIVSLDIS